MTGGNSDGGLGGAGSNKWNKNGFGADVKKQSGKFSRAESDLVRRAIEEYCHAKQIPTARLCSECDHKAELKGAWMEISRRLPHRSVQSVYRHGIRQLHPFKRGAWSDEEVLLLGDLVHKMGKKWSTIQTKINRSADSCRDKYREMSEEFVKGRWKESDAEMLKRVIREQLGVGADMDMKDVGRLVEDQGIQISWSVVSKRMGNRSRLSCFKKWQKMSGLVGAVMGLEDGDEHHGGIHPATAASGGLESSGYGKRGRGDEGGIDDDDEEEEDDHFAALHLRHHGQQPQRQLHLFPPSVSVLPVGPSKRVKAGQHKIEFPQAATAGAAAALAHHRQHAATQQQQHPPPQQQQQQQHLFGQHHQLHLGMAAAALQQQQSHQQQQQQQQHHLSIVPGLSLAQQNPPAMQPHLHQHQQQPLPYHTNEVFFDAQQAEEMVEAVKLPDPGRLK